MASSTTWLVTGSSRGIGRAMVEEIVNTPNQTVIAGIRGKSEGNDTFDVLNASIKNGSKVIVVQIDSNQFSSPEIAAKALKAQGINHIDVLVANAAIGTSYKTVLETPPEAALEHFRINAIGTLTLLQAFAPLLRKSTIEGGPKFAIMSSVAASFARPFPTPSTAYVPSKMAGNYYVTRIHEENPWLTAFCLSPGGVLTDMGNFALKEFGLMNAEGQLVPEMPFKPITAEESGTLCVKRILSATRDNAGGRFLSHDPDAMLEY